MKKEWLILPLSVLLFARVLFLRPQLMEWSRFKTEYSPWTAPSKFIGASSPIFSVGQFPDRVQAVTDVASRFYRVHSNRDGLTSEFINPKLTVHPLYPNLNVGEHSASKASPVVDETGIYVGGDTGWFYAFNLDGSEKWKFHVDSAIRGIHSTALIYNSQVCFGAYNATFYCLSKADGRVIWTSSIPSGGYGASPLVIGDDFITAVEINRPPNGFLARFSLKDGTVIWKSPLFGDQPHSSPAYDDKTKSLYVGDNNHYFYKFESEHGTIKWMINLGAEIKGSPLVVDQTVYIASWSRQMFALDAETGRVRWIGALHGMSQSSPTLFPDGSLVFGDSVGFIYGFDAKTGSKLWEIETGFEVKSSALGVRLPGGLVSTERPATTQPNVRSASTGEKWAAWIACGRNLVCALEPKTGQIINKIELPGSLTGTPVYFRDEIYLALNFPGGLVKLSPVPDSITDKVR